MVTQNNPMEYIWDRIPKQKDGVTIKYLKGDVGYLYNHGFVDTRRYTLEDWQKAFAPFKQEDESYVLDREQFLGLRKYRYNGASHEVFNCGKIREGSWTDDDLQKLFDRSIGVCSNVTDKMFWAYINALKKTGSYSDEEGLFVMNGAVKFGLDALVRRYPSPRTILELEVQRIRQQKEKDMSAHGKNRDKSGFSVGQTESENKAAAFSKMESAKSSKAAETIKSHGDVEEIDIKSLRKPGKNFRG